MNTLSYLGIIILNYNNWSLTINAVNRIRHFYTEVKIIIVDNCSTDQSVEKLREKYQNEENTFFIVNKKNTGYAHGNNTGIRFAKTLNVDTILIMNPDIEVMDSEVLYRMYEILQNNEKIGAITTQTIFNGEFRYPNDCAWHFSNKRNMLFIGTLLHRFSPSTKYSVFSIVENEIAYVDIVQGCFFMSRLENLYRVGLLDENTFLYCEEAILAKKFNQEGLKNAVFVNGVIQHNHKEKETSIIELNSKIFDITCFHESRKYYIKKYSGENKLFVFISTSFLSIDCFIRKTLILFMSRIKRRK